MLQKYAEKAEKQFAIIEEKHAQLIEITEGETEFENEEKWMAECCGSDSHFAAICPAVYGGNEGAVRNQLNGGAEPFQPVRKSTNIATVAERADSELQSWGTSSVATSVRRLVRVLLDGGSRMTLVRKGIFPRTDDDKYQDHDLTVVGSGHVKKKLRLLDCHISDIEGNWSCPLTVIEIDNLCADTPVVLPEQFRQYDHLKDVDIQAVPSETIDVLLGVDNSHLMAWQEYILGKFLTSLSQSSRIEKKTEKLVEDVVSATFCCQERF
ncbi:hypothetical protein HOLleu_09301 [Holothuria leucospilota]|uniref:Uncharacterized protein n=1 Tax=Holothuria leucospilota TaxID=206669 RepID=A0A9Q1CK06_HOLLE|nr:hypothetical protein HOLleu_09301 [Holothuria leucospilota]